MKYLFSFFTVVLFTNLSAQNVYIPDVNFKNRLIEIGIDENNDGEISVEEAEGYNGPLLLDSLGISDLTGIEAFTMVGRLTASYNQITSLELNYHFKLHTLDLRHNQISNLTILFSPLLDSIFCDYNSFTSIDLNNIHNFEVLLIRNNDLSNITINQDLYFFSLDCSNNNIQQIEILNDLQIKELNCSNNSISGTFSISNPYLTKLDCSNNNISELSINDCPELTEVKCNNSEISELIINYADNLNEISYEDNPLTRVHLTHLPSIEILNFKDYDIDSLYVASMYALDSIFCMNNELHYLSVKWCGNLNYINCSNNLLTSLDVDIDNYKLYHIDCSYNQIESLQLNPALKRLYLDNNNLNDDTLHNLSSLSNLLYLSANYTQLKALDLHNSKNHIHTLYCEGNQIAKLKLEGFSKLKFLDCSNNLMDSLILDNCITLDTIRCESNNYSTLDLSHTRDVDYLDISNNENLDIICVVNLPYQFTIKDDNTSQYNMSLCNNEPFENVFTAGQKQNAFYVAEGLNSTYESYYDCNNDGIYDLKNVHGVYNNTGFSFDFTSYAIPLNGSRISSTYDSINIEYDIKGFHIGDPIYPNNFFWYGNNLTFSSGYGFFWPLEVHESWHLSGNHLAVRIITENLDTIYSWVKYEFCGFSIIPLYCINNLASWSPCYLEYSIDYDTTIMLTDFIVLDAGSGYDQYYWSTHDTTQINTITGYELGGGEHEVISYIKLGTCYASDTIKIHVIDNSSIGEYGNQLMRIYPNPCSDVVLIQNFLRKSFKLEISNVAGEIIFSKECEDSDQSIDMRNVPSGLYFVRIYSENISQVTKLVKL